MNVCTSMRTTFTLFVAAAALSAQPPGGFMRFHPVLSALDADQNGTISAQELQSASQVLGKLDQNHDGRVTAEEMRPRFGPGGARGGRPEGRGPGGPGGADPAAMAEQLMQFDKNADGALTKEEVPERMQGLFARADADKDGRLTRAELTQRANAAPAGGRDHEGPGGGRPRDPIVAALDANQDGALDAQEMQNSAAALAKLDKNADGQLQEEKVRPPMMRDGRGFGPRGGERGQRP